MTSTPPPASAEYGGVIKRHSAPPPQYPTAASKTRYETRYTTFVFFFLILTLPIGRQVLAAADGDGDVLADAVGAGGVARTAAGADAAPPVGVGGGGAGVAVGPPLRRPDVAPHWPRLLPQPPAGPALRRPLRRRFR